MGKYESGTKSDVARKMMTYAIRDQDTLIDALGPDNLNADTQEAILDAEKCIRDFKHLCKTICKEV